MAKRRELASRLFETVPRQARRQADIWAQGGCDIWRQQLPKSFLIRRRAEFRLPATDGKTYALDDVGGRKKATVVVFICNHCPYV